jgi:anti-sigma B factor antagonist
MGDDFGDGFEIAERQDGTRTVVALRGELDLATVDAVRERLEALRSDGRPAVLDLDGLSFMDSTGIRLVLEAAQLAAADGWVFTLTRGSGAVQRIFAAARIDDRLPYEDGARE